MFAVSPTAPHNDASTAASPTLNEQQSKPSYRLWQLLAYVLGLGTWGFGGPVALVGYMHRDLVERRKWITEAEYKEGLTLSQIMPGPLAAQLAIYLGYVHYGALGAALVGVAFVLPSFLIVVALGWAYRQFGGLPWMQAVFYGVGASVIGIIALSAYKLTQKSIGRDRLLAAIFLISAATTVVTESEWVALFLLAGVVVWVARQPPRGLNQLPVPSLILLPPLAVAASTADASSTERLWQIAWFFTKAGAFVFGSGLAIVPFLYSGVVKEYGWLNDQEFVDAVAVAMITPGPVVITVGFVGYLVEGFPGATVAAIATFLPCYFFTVVPAPYFKKYGKRPALIAFVDGVTASAIGAIAGAVIVIGRRTLLNGSVPEWPKVIICLTTLVLLMRFKKLPEPLLVAGAAVTGMLIYPLVTK
jgi:chromate transporter